MQRAWCFDHGTLHRFGEDGERCNAAWVPLDGETDEEALNQKELMWGPGQFFGDLDLERQGGLIAITEKRRFTKSVTERGKQ